MRVSSVSVSFLEKHSFQLCNNKLIVVAQLEKDSFFFRVVINLEEDEVSEAEEILAKLDSFPEHTEGVCSRIVQLCANHEPLLFYPEQERMYV